MTSVKHNYPLKPSRESLNVANSKLGQPDLIQISTPENFPFHKD